MQLYNSICHGGGQNGQDKMTSHLNSCPLINLLLYSIRNNPMYMEIIGVEVNGVRLMKFNRKQNPTWFYQRFMEHCIDNHFPQIHMDERLHSYFSQSSNDPVFKSAIGTSAVVNHHDTHYSTHNGTPDKIGIMIHLANLLDIDFKVFTI
jgi:hypothetical protein